MRVVFYIPKYKIKSLLLFVDIQFRLLLLQCRHIAKGNNLQHILFAPSKSFIRLVAFTQNCLR